MGRVAYKGLKKCCGGGGVESDYSVCPRPLLLFLQFMSDRLHQVTQVTSGYVSLRQGTDVELDNVLFNICLHLSP